MQPEVLAAPRALPLRRTPIRSVETAQVEPAISLKPHYVYGRRFKREFEMDGVVKRVAVVLLAAALHVPATFAFYSDVEVSVGNTFAATTVFDEGVEETSLVMADHVVISEIQIIGANANQDFIELYNPTDAALDISGWKLRVRNSSGNESSINVFDSGESIPAHGFFLWANSQSDYDDSIGADTSSTANISENNSIALLTPANAIVDQVAWGNSTSPFVESAAIGESADNNESYERKALSTSTTSTMIGADAAKGNGFDGGDNATDFTLRAAAQPQNSLSAPETP
jgi:hypothetical protein